MCESLDILYWYEGEDVIRKWVYPYEQMNSFNRFEETGLPPVEKLYFTLNEE